MDLNSIFAAVSKMFPSIDLQHVVSRAQEATKGTPDSLQGVSQTAQQMGLDRAAIDQIYQRYGRSVQARTICKLLGTTPEALKADADRIIGGTGTAPPPSQSTAKTQTKFPRLK